MYVGRQVCRYIGMYVLCRQVCRHVCMSQAQHVQQDLINKTSKPSGVSLGSSGFVSVGQWSHFLVKCGYLVGQWSHFSVKWSCLVGQWGHSQPPAQVGLNQKYKIGFSKITHKPFQLEPSCKNNIFYPISQQFKSRRRSLYP